MPNTPKPDKSLRPFTVTVIFSAKPSDVIVTSAVALGVQAALEGTMVNVNGLAAWAGEASRAPQPTAATSAGRRWTPVETRGAIAVMVPSLILPECLTAPVGPSPTRRGLT